MNTNTIKMWLVPMMVVATIAVNALANILPFNGKTTGEISNAIPILFAPANYVFGIWSLIYFGLCVFAIAQLTKKFRDDNTIKRLRLWFLLNCIANSGWIVLWHYGYFWSSVAVMILLFLTLIMIYVPILNAGKEKRSTLFWLCVEAPCSLYIGWITVALIANIATALRVNEWSGWGISAEIWTVTMLVVACTLGIITVLQRKDPVFGAVLIWASTGIAINQMEYPVIAFTALTISSILTAVSFVGAIRRFKFQRN